MSLKAYEENDIQDIATAIRAKNGETSLYTVAQMPAAIERINTSGGAGVSQYIINRFQDWSTFASGEVVGIEVPDGVTDLQCFMGGQYSGICRFKNDVHVKIWIPATVITISVFASPNYLNFYTPFYQLFVNNATAIVTNRNLHVFIEHASIPSGWNSNWNIINAQSSTSYDRIPTADIFLGATYQNFVDDDFS